MKTRLAPCLPVSRTFSLAFFLCILAALLSPASVQAETNGPDGIRQTLDVPYAHDSERQTLDVFAPRGANGAPVVILVHGGTWMFGDKNFRGRYRPGCQALARQGVVMVSINYRLSPGVKHPEHVKDLARAFAWVRGHIGDHGGDRDRILLCGHSAGGHLVSLLASANTYWENKALRLTAADRAALRGVIAVCGVYRIPDPDEFATMSREMLRTRLLDHDGRPRMPATLIPILTLASEKANPFSLVFGDDEKVCKEASPLTHVRKGLPPFLLLNAERELPLLREMAREFQKDLKKAEVPVEYRQIAGSTHHDILFRLNRPDDPVARELLQFTNHFGGPRVRKMP
jgi:acetyl esterase/lipase